MDQPKLERLLRLMKMLTGNVSYSITDISNRLEMSERTVYRYIDTFREAGFVIKRRGNIFKIDKSSPYFKDISSLLHFTEEESHILKKAIDSIDDNNLMKQNLKRKLATVYDYKILAETTVKGKNADNINRLVDAIENKFQVELNQYSSANSKIISNRLVEPFAFTSNYIQIWAFEIESGQNKLFKVSRIGDVNVSNQKWKFQKNHKVGFIDIFRISSYQQINVKLKLGLRAAMLLTEEYPLSERDMKKINDNEWLLDTNVCSFDGIGRFVMGLFNDIQIIESDDFKSFMKNKIQNMNLI